MTPSPLRAIPSVEKILRALSPLDLTAAGRVTALVRRELASLRGPIPPANAVPAFDLRRWTGCAPPMDHLRADPACNR